MHARVNVGETVLAIAKGLLGTLDDEDRPKHLVKVLVEVIATGEGDKKPLRGVIVFLIWEAAEYDIRIMHDSATGFDAVKDPHFDTEGWKVAIPLGGEKIDRTLPPSPLYDLKNLDLLGRYDEPVRTIAEVVQAFCDRSGGKDGGLPFTSISLSFADECPTLIPVVGITVNEEEKTFSFRPWQIGEKELADWMRQ